MLNIIDIINEEIMIIESDEHHRNLNEDDKNQWKLINSDTYTGIAGGTMGTPTNKYVAGRRNTYEYNDYIIHEYIPNPNIKRTDKRTHYDVLGFKNPTTDDERTYSVSFSGEIDWNKVNELEKTAYDRMINKVNSTDVKKAIEFINKNKEGFVHLINTMVEKGIPTYQAFLEVVRDFYRGAIPIPFNTEVLARIAINKGMEIESLDDIYEIIYGENHMNKIKKDRNRPLR